MQQAAVKEPGGDQPPPLSGEDQGAEFRSELDQRPVVDPHEPAAGSHRGEHEQAGIDDQDDHRDEIIRGDADRVRGPGIDDPASQLNLAVRANFVVGGDESPAIRAHAALVHCVPPL